MDLKIENKTAFISGSTSGIGFATARVLLQEGARVIINGRTQDGVEKAVNKLKQLKPKASIGGFAADFSDASSVKSLLKDLPEIDILINNVGIYSAQSFFETSDDEWFRMFEVNVMSGVRLSRQILPQMLSKNWGRILFVSSECANLVPGDLLAYSMTKTALLSVSRGLAQLTKGTEVTVNSVVPGSTLSEGAEHFLEEQAKTKKTSRQAVENDFFKNIRTTSLLQRFATVDEIANTIAYLSSPLAAATNGAAIKIDGGSSGGII